MGASPQLPRALTEELGALWAQVLVAEYQRRHEVASARSNPHQDQTVRETDRRCRPGPLPSDRAGRPLRRFGLRLEAACKPTLAKTKSRSLQRLEHVLLELRQLFEEQTARPRCADLPA